MPKLFKKGERRVGRKKGVPNKSTQAVKDAINAAFNGAGGVPALVAWAKKNRSLFYTKVWIRVLPLEVKAEHKGSVTLEQLVAGAAVQADKAEDKNGEHG